MHSRLGWASQPAVCRHCCTVHPQVCDFNLSEILRQQPAADDEQGMGATNPRWLAPEVLEGKRATADVDVYAFGLVRGGDCCAANEALQLRCSAAAAAAR